jgi:protein-tyrosine sulfotransferase
MDSLQIRHDEPVIVLTCGRSGSTLMRFILDAHPALACPPEISLVEICSRMGVLSMLLDGPPLDGVTPSVSETAADAIRAWLAATFAPYLERRGKGRWCEKSLGSAESADRFLSLFPKAKFICLYRHSMDVIGSALEACPFGLRGYGLDPYAAVHPGNSVAAVADYWICHTRTIMEFEARHPDSCVRVRYEDLVTEPEAQAKRVFDFLGEDQAPAATSAAFTAIDAEQFGPGDHKIWDTTGVHDDSVGRGAEVPAGLVPPQVLEIMNSILEKLGTGR